MERKTVDRRILKTKKAIYGALATILMKKNANEITVSELAATAGINRKTFYNSYAGIHEVIRELEDGIVDRFLKAIEGYTYRQLANDPYLIFEKLTAVISEDSEFYGALMQSSENYHLIKKVIDSFHSQIKENVLGNCVALDEQTLDVLLDYDLYGIIGTYQSWFLSGCKESVEEVSKKLSLLITKGLAGILETREELE